jgi:hypothetical protein
VPDRGCFVLRRGLSTVGPKTFAFELIKEICKCPVARQSCRLVGGEAATLDPNTHRFPSSHYSPAPRRWIDRNAGRKYVVAPMVQSLNHCLRIVVDDANAGTAFADFGRLKGPLAMTFIVRGRRCERPQRLFGCVPKQRSPKRATSLLRAGKYSLNARTVSETIQTTSTIYSLTVKMIPRRCAKRIANLMSLFDAF